MKKENENYPYNKKALICYLCGILIMMIAIIELPNFGPTVRFTGPLPYVELQYKDSSGAKEGKFIAMWGCTWTYEETEEQESFTERIDYRLTDSNVKLNEISINPHTEIKIHIDYEDKPTRIVIKSFEENEVVDYSKGKIISENETDFIAFLNKIYAIELEFGENHIMHAVRCV